MPPNPITRTGRTSNTLGRAGPPVLAPNVQRPSLFLSEILTRIFKSHAVFWRPDLVSPSLPHTPAAAATTMNSADAAADRSSRSFPTLISYLLASVDETLSLAASIPSFAALIHRLTPILHSLHHRPSLPSLHRCTESLDASLRHARELLRSDPSDEAIESSAHSIARCVCLLLMVWDEAPGDVRELMTSLHRDMAAFRFREIAADIEDVLLRVKKGSEEAELGAALSELGALITEGSIGELGRSVFISVLLSRLGSARKDNRLKLIILLRRVASCSDEHKERMAGREALSCIVRSLARDVDESREAVGLLLELAGIPEVREKIGRIQGCMLMLATLLNGHDPVAARDAASLLQALSRNPKNVLLMAEAGYFAPLVRYLKEGSDMNKIVMASAISRMELTSQMKASLGEGGSIEILVKMFTSERLEAKLSALGALRNLSSWDENIPPLINAGIVPPLIQLLFSVTSGVMTLREPASAILASIAQSDLILKYKDVAQQMVSLLNLSSPTIQLHLLMALNSIVSHSNSRRVKAKLKENGAMQLLLPFLTESNSEVRTIALNLIFNLSEDSAEEVAEQLGEIYLDILVYIISAAVTEKEKAFAVGILSNLPVKDKITTEFLARANILPVLISLVEGSIRNSTPTRNFLLEGIAGVLVRYTVPWDKRLQRLAVTQGVIPCLMILLRNGSAAAKSRAATSLAQLSQNSVSLSKVKLSSWLCVPPHSQAFCEVHSGYCSAKSTFCLVKAGALSPLLRVLEGKEREADEAVLNALATIMQDETWKNGSDAVVKESGVQALLRVLEIGNLKSQEKAVWMLERIFRIETHKAQYGETAGVVLIDLAQRSEQTLKPAIAKVLAHLQLLQMQSSYF